MRNQERIADICSSDIGSENIRFDRVTEVVKDLCAMFRTGGRTSHIEPVPIPSKDGIVDLVLQLQQVLFPGYFTDIILTPENLEYHLGHKLSVLYELLAQQISSAIRHDCFRHKQSCSNCGERSYKIAEAFIESLPAIRERLESDIEATLVGDPAAANADEVIFSYPGLFATMVYRMAHRLVELEVPIIPRIMSEYAYNRTTIDINPEANIGASFFIDHGAGVVVGATTDIGNRVRIYQGVTLGAMSLPKDAGVRLRHTKRHPTIEDDVIIYANATILGGDTVVGARSIVGGNVWLTQSVGPDTKVLLKQPELVYLGSKEE